MTAFMRARSSGLMVSTHVFDLDNAESCEHSQTPKLC